MIPAQYTPVPDGEDSRWFYVVAERFDWVIRPGLMRSFEHGRVYCAPMECARLGRDQGLVVMIRPPEDRKKGLYP